MKALKQEGNDETQEKEEEEKRGGKKKEITLLKGHLESLNECSLNKHTQNTRIVAAAALLPVRCRQNQNQRTILPLSPHECLRFRFQLRLTDRRHSSLSLALSLSHLSLLLPSFLPSWCALSCPILSSCAISMRKEVKNQKRKTGRKEWSAR